MKQRWLVAVIGLPLLILVLAACPAWATWLLVCVIAGVAAYELLHTAGKHANRAVYAATILAAVAQIYIVYHHKLFMGAAVSMSQQANHAPEAGAGGLWQIPWLLTVVLFLIAIVTHGKKGAVLFPTVAAACIGGIAFPMMYSCILLLRMQEDFGRVYVLAPFFIAFAGDSLSMYFGMWWGKKKMAPRVSPNKTWAGFWGGPFGGALGMLLLGFLGEKWLGYAPVYSLLALVGVVGNLFGQLGDLSMSLIKRENGVKDYSHLLLTHGGILDRFDSTMFIAPVVYFFVGSGII